MIKTLPTCHYQNTILETDMCYFTDIAVLPSSGDWNVVLTDMIFGFDIVVAENYRP